LTSDAESTAPSLPAGGASNQPYTIDPLEHLKLARSIARKFYRKVNHRVDRADILGAAYEGLIKGCRDFDPLKGVKPSTFLHAVIQNEILGLFGKPSMLGRNPSRARIVSLEDRTSLSSEDAPTILETLQAPEEKPLFTPQLQEIASEWLQSLPPMHAKIINLRLLERKSCGDIAKELGTTRQAVNQIEQRALQDLKHRIGNVE